VLAAVGRNVTLWKKIAGLVVEEQMPMLLFRLWTAVAVDAALNAKQATLGNVDVFNTVLCRSVVVPACGLRTAMHPIVEVMPSIAPMAGTLLVKQFQTMQFSMTPFWKYAAFWPKKPMPGPSGISRTMQRRITMSVGRNTKTPRLLALPRIPKFGPPNTSRPSIVTQDWVMAIPPRP